jgi:hypothetical protein
MSDRFLVVRGVRTTDELIALGLPMAQKYDQADVVALVGNDNRGVLVKGVKEATLVELFDADASVGRVSRAIQRVHDAAKHLDHESQNTDPHSHVGLFLFYWPLAIGDVRPVIDGIASGMVEMVEEAAQHYIDTALGSLERDEHRDAGGHAAN